VGAATSTIFSTALENSTSYIAKVRVRDASGSWSAWDEVSFSTAFLPPANVTVTPTFDQDHGWVVLTGVADGYVPGVTMTVSNVTVQRRRNGGDWVEVASGLNGNFVVVDTAPTTHGLNE